MSGPRKKGAFKVPHGPTIIQKVWDQMDRAMVKYLENPTDQRRGIVRGLATAVALYESPGSPNVKEVERRYLRKHKAQG